MKVYIVMRKIGVSNGTLPSGTILKVFRNYELARKYMYEYTDGFISYTKKRDRDHHVEKFSDYSTIFYNDQDYENTVMEVFIVEQDVIEENKELW